MRHGEPLAALHRVIPAQAGIQACLQRTAAEAPASLFKSW